MGEYGTVRGTGERVKLGTCEDFYYLRWNQRDRITDYSFDQETLNVSRFRFPFPDEDGIGPGAFDDHDRGLRLWGFTQPTEVEHGSTQFVASYPKNGYVVSLPCPEGPDADPRVHRNGYGGPASLVQQGWRDGRLVGIARCNGCGARYRLEDGHEQAVAVCIRSQADEQIRTAEERGTEGNRDIGLRLHEVADRLLAGYAEGKVQR